MADVTDAEWARQSRTATGLSRREVSRRTGFTYGRITAIESGEGRAISDSERQVLIDLYSRIRYTIPRQTPIKIDWSALQKRATETTVPPDTLTMTAVQPRGETDQPTRPDPNAGYRLYSNSEFKTYQQCQRKWWLAWIRGLQPNNRSPLGALAVGDRVHRALQRMYVPHGTEPIDPRVALEQVITEDWTRLAEHLGEGSTELSALAPIIYKETDLERAMISGYVEWLEETGADSDIEVISSEQYLEAEFQLPDGYLPSKIIGKLDARVRRISDKVVAFIDHKTVQNLTQPIRTLTINTQMLHYMLLERLNGCESVCTTGIYNMLRKVKRTKTASPPFYGRFEVRHNKQALSSYERHIRRLAMDMQDTEGLLGTTEHHDVVPPNPGEDCSWKCPFAHVCSMFDDGSRIEDMLAEDFHVGPPLGYYMRAEQRNESSI